jgi:uncharacterized protein (DUF58 family)
MLVDASGSMGYGQSTLTKFEYARIFAAALGHLLLNQRDAVGLHTFDTELRDQLKPSASPKNFKRLLGTLEQTEIGGETSLSSVISSIVPTLKRRSLVCLFSDCFDKLESLTDLLQRLRHANHDVVLFQIVAPEEEDFPFSRPTQFRNLEREGHHLLTDPNKLREHYLEQYQAFCESIDKVCGSVAVDHVKVLTTEPFHEALGKWLDSRARRR